MPVNPELLNMARHAVKTGFVAAGDPAMGASPAGADPSAAGGAMPPDAAAGGAAPMPDPAMGAGGDPLAGLMPMIQTAVQQALASSGGAAAGAPSAGIKPKIDVNVELMQIKKLLARMADALGIAIPAAEMVATPDDLSQMAQASTGGAQSGAQGGALGQIAPVAPLKAAAATTFGEALAADWEDGVAYGDSGLSSAHANTRNTANLAAALLAKRR